MESKIITVEYVPVREMKYAVICRDSTGVIVLARTRSKPSAEKKAIAFRNDLRSGQFLKADKSIYK